ncbi:unnamed protein product [Urochloa decumbens]|uniref:non-specific serine/threonine protein kinase n=1 Tax=Urochloa decumbens TaxID=240449 RepID=A0ABC8VC70_9POAL
MEPSSHHGYNAATTTTTHIALVLLLLSSAFIFSESIQLPKSTIYNTTIDGKQFTTFYFTDFDKQQPQQPGILILSSNSSVSSGALQITPDSLQNASRYLVNQTGRVFFPSPFTLWSYNAAASSNSSAESKRVASFNTSFMFNLFRTNTSFKGEGLTFLIASGNDEPPPGSYGGYLGLTNASTDGFAANGFVAVELDTVKQPYDPDDNHVGLNVNGVRSRYATPLGPHGIQLAPTNASTGTYNAWVDYNGTTRRISVYMSADESKPATAMLDAPVDLSGILLGRKAFFGFSASTGVHYQLNCVLQWMMTVEMLEDSSSATKKTSSGSGLKLRVIVEEEEAEGRHDMSLFDNTMTLTAIPGLMPKVFDYKELSRGTNDFDEKMKLGQGGYGVVYRATVAGKDGKNMEVAVKRFSGANTKGQQDFLAELSIINSLRHRNLVKLNGVLMLVYDYMPNGSLDKHIFSGKDAPVLSWQQRYNVVAGVASALNYLHEYDQMVVHRDIKPSNIMLVDSAFDARLGDFGLARALDTGNSRAGFSQLLEWVWRLHGAGRILDAVDPRLAGEFVEEDAERLLLLGLASSHPNAGERPGTKAILQNLERSVSPFAVPLERPAFTWPVEPVANVEEDSGTAPIMSHPNS